MWNLKKWFRSYCLQSRETQDAENKYMDTKAGGSRRNGETGTKMCTLLILTTCKTDN